MRLVRHAAGTLPQKHFHAFNRFHFLASDLNFFAIARHWSSAIRRGVDPVGVLDRGVASILLIGDQEICSPKNANTTIDFTLLN